MTNPPGHEPSNAELMVLLKHLAESGESRDRAQTERAGALRNEVQKLGSQFVGFEQRLSKVEQAIPKAATDSRRALDSQADLEGSMHRELSGLADNDRKQNAAIADIKVETHKQSAVLKEQSAVLEEQSTVLAEIVGWKQQILLLIKLFKSLRLVVAGGTIVVSVVTWLVTHWK